MNGEEPRQDEREIPVKARIYLIDPGDMTVLWMNESASMDLRPGLDPKSSEVKLEDAVPLSEDLGLREALSAAARTGTPQHRRSDLISSSRGSMLTVASAYRLPEGNLLLVTEVAWHAKKRDIAGTRSRPRGRR